MSRGAFRIVASTRIPNLEHMDKQPAPTAQITLLVDGKTVKTRTLKGLAAKMALWAMDHEDVLSDDSLRGRLILNFDASAASIKPEAEIVIN